MDNNFKIERTAKRYKKGKDLRKAQRAAKQQRRKAYWG